MSRDAGWRRDPLDRHELRYWDGAQWTEDVSDQGVTATDPLTMQPFPPPKGITTPRVIVTVVAAVVVVGALFAFSTRSSGDDEPRVSGLAASFCADLRDGLSMNQLYTPVSDQYSPERFAELAYGWSAQHCREQLRTNEGLRSFIENYSGLNPDVVP